MLFPRTNIEQQLNKLRNKDFDASTWKNQVQEIFEKDQIHEEQILANLNTDSNVDSNAFEFDLLETHKIYHLDHIKKIMH